MTSITLPAAALEAASLFVVDKKDSRTCLRGVDIRIENALTHVTATNGHILYRGTFPNILSENFTQPVILDFGGKPLKWPKDAIGYLEGNITLRQSETAEAPAYVFTHSGGSSLLPVIDSQFPDVDQILPKSAPAASCIAKCFKADYLALICKAAKVLNKAEPEIIFYPAEPDCPAYFTLPTAGVVESRVLLMPRTNENTDTKSAAFRRGLECRST